MPDVQLEVSLPLAPPQAFDIFVQQMNIWWPRQGVFPYSFAPASTRPLRIEFEAQLGGRYYETFADGSQYVIGRITQWDPPLSLAYSWRDPSWPGETQITLRFAAADAGACVAYEQDGFAKAGVPELVPYYQIGCRQTLAGYVAHCRALRELQALSGGAD